MFTEDQFHEILDELISAYGYDFKSYSKASLRRRVERLMKLDQIEGYTELIFKIRNDPKYIDHFINEVSVNVTEMFRDPSFYKFLREKIIPIIATNPRIKIWHAGCATGEEVLSMAIMLKEQNLLYKSMLYATDISTEALSNFKKLKIPLSNMKLYTENYHASGGTGDFSEYYTAKYNHVIFDKTLMENVLYSVHNLVSDGSFNEFDLILCRNVLIYFDKDLQNRVFNLFNDSLSNHGFLALGSRENIRFSDIYDKYDQLGSEKIWRKTFN